MKVPIAMVIALGIAACAQPGGTSSMSKAEAEYAWRASTGQEGNRNPAAIPMYEAIINGDRRAVEHLLAQGLSPNQLLAPHSWSPLQVAIYRGDREMVELLVGHGANLDHLSSVTTNETPLATALSFAIPRQDFSIFNYLINKGADINLRYDGDDIAIYAAVLGQMNIVNDLLEKGYRRDLKELRRVIEFRQVDAEGQIEKSKVLGNIKKLLSK